MSEGEKLSSVYSSRGVSETKASWTCTSKNRAWYTRSKKNQNMFGTKRIVTKVGTHRVINTLRNILEYY